MERVYEHEISAVFGAPVSKRAQIREVPKPPRPLTACLIQLSHDAPNGRIDVHATALWRADYRSFSNRILTVNCKRKERDRRIVQLCARDTGHERVPTCGHIGRQLKLCLTNGDVIDSHIGYEVLDLGNVATRCVLEDEFKVHLDARRYVHQHRCDVAGSLHERGRNHPAQVPSAGPRKSGTSSRIRAGVDIQRREHRAQRWFGDGYAITAPIKVATGDAVLLGEFGEDLMRNGCSHRAECMQRAQTIADGRATPNRFASVPLWRNA